MIPLQGSALMRTFVDEAIRLNGRIAVLEAEVAFLRRGIEAYRQEHHSQDDPCEPDDEPCAVCQWEDEAEAREAGR